MRVESSRVAISAFPRRGRVHRAYSCLSVVVQHWTGLRPFNARPPALLAALFLVAASWIDLSERASLAFSCCSFWFSWIMSVALDSVNALQVFIGCLRAMDCCIPYFASLPHNCLIPRSHVRYCLLVLDCIAANAGNELLSATEASASAARDWAASWPPKLRLKATCVTPTSSDSD